MGFISIVFLFSLIPFQTFSKINIKGNDFFTSEEILNSLNLNAAGTYSEESLTVYVEKILYFYKNEGFLNAEIQHEIRENGIVLTITEGEQFTVGVFEIKGNRFVKAEILRRFLDINEKEPFSTRKFHEGIDEILQFYGNRGFPFTRIIPSNFVSEGNKISISLEIEEGPRLRWGEIIVQGNTLTKDYVIKKQMKIPKKEYFSESQLHISRAWITKLPYIEIEKEIELVKGEESGTVGLLVTVKELTSNRINGIAGYIPTDEAQKGGFVGLISAEMLNLFGTGRALQIKWEKQIPPYTKLDVLYKEPWILGSRIHLKLSLFHLLEDTLYSLSKAQIELETFVSLNLGLSLTGGMEIFNPVTIGIPRSKKYSLGTGFIYSNLDYFSNPRKGIDYKFYTEYGKKGSTNVVKLTLDLLNVIPLFSNNVVAVLLSGKAIRTNHSPLPPYEQFPLGGFNSLRGYRDRQFRAVQMFRGSPEYRFLISRISRLYLFYDFAYFKTSNYPTGNTDNLYKDGFGIGAKFSSRLGIISLEYAMGEERTFMKGKVHIGIDSSF